MLLGLAADVVLALPLSLEVPPGHCLHWMLPQPFFLEDFDLSLEDFVLFSTVINLFLKAINLL